MYIFLIQPEYGKSLVQGNNWFYKVVIVDAAHKVSQKILSNLKMDNIIGPNTEKKILVLKLYLRTDAGKDELKQVQHTGARVGPAQVLVNQVWTKISRLKFSPDG